MRRKRIYLQYNTSSICLRVGMDPGREKRAPSPETCVSALAVVHNQLNSSRNAFYHLVLFAYSIHLIESSVISSSSSEELPSSTRSLPARRDKLIQGKTSRLLVNPHHPYQATRQCDGSARCSPTLFENGTLERCSWM